MTNLNIKIDEIDLNIAEIKTIISNLRHSDTSTETTDFYKKMLDLSHASPEFFDLLQLIIMLFSKMETNNKNLKDHIMDYGISGATIKTNLSEIIRELVKIVDLDKNLNDTIYRLEILEKHIHVVALDIEETKLNLISNPKEAQDAPAGAGASTDPSQSPSVGNIFKNYITDSANFTKVLIGGSIVVVFFTAFILEAYAPDTFHNTIKSIKEIIIGGNVNAGGK